MNRSVLELGLGIVMTSALAVSGAAAATFSQDFPRPHTEIWFKLTAGGQIDAAAGTASFAGQATHVGQFTTTAPIDPWGAIEGTLISASGETLYYYLFFFAEYPSGELRAHFQLVGGTGGFSNFYGGVEGPVSIDDDGMFTMRVSGRISIPIIE